MHMLEKEMAIHSSILAWRIPMDRGAWQATVHGVLRVRHDLASKPPQQPYTYVTLLGLENFLFFKDPAPNVKVFNHKLWRAWDFTLLGSFPQFIDVY